MHKKDISYTITTDVLIIGGGTAGATAAIEAKTYGVDVAIIEKGRFGFGGSTCTSDGETSGIFHKDDNADIFLAETIKGGENVAIKELVETLVFQSNETVLKLKEYGVPFATFDNGDLMLYKELGMDYPRTPKVKGGGPAFITALCKEALYRGVELFENIMVVDLLTGAAGNPIGCLGIHITTGELFFFKAKSVILAAGSATKLFPQSSANFLTTGDGYWLAYDLGAEFVNMEFPEFTIIPAPRGVPLHTGGIKPLTGRGARFFNNRNERFMEKHDPERKELVKRTKLVQALYTEIVNGRGPVCMDMTHFDEKEFVHMETVLHQGIIKKLREVGVDYRNERFEWISPAIHTFLGGVRINKNSETNVPGLFAAGENAGGVYGADRVGTYLTACALFGFKAGEMAAVFSTSKYQEEVKNDELTDKMDKLNTLCLPNGDLLADEIEESIRKAAGDFLTLERQATGLKKTLMICDEVSKLLDKVKIKSTRNLIKTLENRNLALTAELVAKAALTRKESRGQHKRIDYPEKETSGPFLVILSKKGTQVISNS